MKVVQVRLSGTRLPIKWFYYYVSLMNQINDFHNKTIKENIFIAANSFGNITPLARGRRNPLVYRGMDRDDSCGRGSGSFSMSNVKRFDQDTTP